ncbi:MAG TPA: polymer-forming cytoskeletal protein [Geminicoccaceae bacterium]|nr:polymer-forming cytoskeletal protein [Geminicoccaceae bacterium]
MMFKQNARPPLPRDPVEDSLPPVMGASPPAKAAPAVAPDGGKRLIVGQGIKLKGEISACDRLIVEGHVEVTLNDTRTVEIKPSGRFIGSCEVEQAEISGVYEGDLTVRGRLSVHASGVVTGNIHYGEIELERGGRIAGELKVRDSGAAASKSGDSQRATKAA